jgi:sugar (pentulose or hexulose) kinase
VFPLTINRARSNRRWNGGRALLAIVNRITAKRCGKKCKNDIKAIAVTSTSGTVIPLDKDNKPLHNAIMYSDKRSVKQADVCTAAALKYHNSGYTTFNFPAAWLKWYGL